jgi:CO dehydrogenase maturation factor
MTTTIALAGKGGTGKTTLAGLLIRYLIQHRLGDVLAVEEGDGFDLLAMGRPEGQGCYCAANHMLRTIVDGICKTYDYVVMDNEAGMEHLSRRTTRDVDHLLLVSDASLRGLTAAEAMLALSHELDINVRKTSLIVNRVNGDLPAAFQPRIEQMGLPLLATVPYDAQLAEFDGGGRPLVELPAESPVSQAADRIARQLLAA